MKCSPALVVVASFYLLAASGVTYAWLAWPRQPLPWYVAVCCALPMLVYAPLALTSATLERLVARSVACVGMMPVLLLMWAGSGEFETPAPSEPATSGAQPLDPHTLFAGALTTQQLPPASGGIALQAAAFADGSELRVLQLETPSAAEAQRALIAGAFAGQPTTLAGRRGVRAQTADMVLFWELHGSTLLELRARDDASAIARLAAQHVPMPSAAPVAAAPAEARAVWPFALSFSLAHGLLFCLFVLWAGPATTRVPRAPNAEAVGAAQLRQRLSSLEQQGAGLRLEPAIHEAELVLHLVSAAQRSHRLTLYVDEAKRLVRVREVEGADGAAPRDAAEADMRIGKLGIDPSRPKARAVWGRSIQTSLIDSERLAALPTRLRGADVQVDGVELVMLDATELIHLVCAVVTRSGFDWQPVFRLPSA